MKNSIESLKKEMDNSGERISKIKDQYDRNFRKIDQRK